MIRPFDPHDTDLMRFDRIVADSGTGLLWLLTFFAVYGVFLKNAAVPIVTVIGIGLALLISGVVITETVFNIPGIGRYVRNILQAIPTLRPDVRFTFYTKPLDVDEAANDAAIATRIKRDRKTPYRTTASRTVTFALAGRAGTFVVPANLADVSSMITLASMNRLSIRRSFSLRPDRSAVRRNGA